MRDRIQAREARTANAAQEQTDAVFVRCNGHPGRLRSDPRTGADVADAQALADDVDWVNVMSLAMIRQATQTTQVEVAC